MAFATGACATVFVGATCGATIVCVGAAVVGAGFVEPVIGAVAGAVVDAYQV